MSETQTLWLVLAFVYAIECGCWLRHGAVGFRTWLGRHWRIVLPGKIIGNNRGGFVPVHPLPPLGTILKANALPLALAAEGLAAEESAVTWSNIKRIEVTNKTLRVNGSDFVNAGCNELATELARVLKRIAALPSDARADAIRTLLRRMLDETELRARWEDFDRSSKRLRWLCCGLFGFLFGVAPVVVLFVGLARSWGALLPGVFAFTIPIALMFRAHHRQLYPDAEDNRFSLFLTYLLSPASAVRAVDGLSLPLLTTFHPLAVARVFGDELAFHGLAAAFLREARFAARASPTGAAGAFRRFANDEWRAVLEAWLRAQKVDLEELVRPPPPNDPASVSYCPRCLAQFVTPTGRCADCRGVELKQFKSPA